MQARPQINSTVYYNILDNMPGMFYRCKNDADWTMIFVSRGCTELTGYTGAELLKNARVSYSSIIHPDDRGWLAAKCSYNIEHKLECNNEYRIISKQGSIKWVKEIACGVYNASGELEYIEGYITDITHEKKKDDIVNSLNAYQRAVNSAAIVSLTDINGNIIFANELFCKVSKYTQQELIGKNHRIVNSGFHPPEFFANLWNTLKAGQIWRGEIKNKAKDGTYYWVDTTITPLFNTEGEIIQFLSIRFLNTERRQLQEELLKFRQAIDTSTDNLFIIDIATMRYIDFNDRVIKDLGYSRDELLDMGPQDIVQMPGDELFLKFSEILMHPRKFGVLETRHRKKNGELIDVEVHIKGLPETGGKQLFVASARDLTSTKKVVTQLYEAQRIAKIGSWYLDIVNDRLEWSAETYRIFDIPVGTQLTYSDFLNKVHTEDRDYLNAKWQAALCGNEYSVEHRILAGKEIKWVRQIAHLDIGHDGAILGCIGTIQDITEQKQKQMEADKLLLDLTNRNNELMQFNYIVSHNIRGPLTNILGLTNLVENHSDENIGDIKDILRGVTKSALQIDQVINDLVVLLSTKNPLNLKIERVDFEQIVQAVESSMELQIKEACAIIQLETDEQAGSFNSIKSYLQSILYNLVNNAIKYKDPDRPPKIKITTAKHNGGIVITVEDNGSGMDMNIFGSKIFGLYKRYHLNIEGRGLGLHMVKIQVETLGCTIKVDSEPGKGTIFTISLPKMELPEIE